jgi:hypothetical protein
MIRVSIDHARRTRFVYFENTVDDVQLLETYKKLLEDPDFDINYIDLVDLSSVDQFDITSNGLRKVADFLKPFIGEQIRSKLAIVATKAHVYGMARMYQMIRGDKPRQVRVFRDTKCRTVLAWNFFVLISIS